MNLSERILEFYRELELHDSLLPKNVKALNPYKNPPAEVAMAINTFYRKFYDDDQSRGLILGINPGRFGAGVTGIPFTDSYRLEEDCGIPFPGDTRETSSLFVYEVIRAYGGAERFFKDWFIGAVSPLGFIKKNTKGNWVNWNYYDESTLENALQPFIIQQLTKQIEICGHPKKCVVLGTGKNYKYLKKLNEKQGFFEEIIPLEHPRYIMQYKLKTKDSYVDKFLNVLGSR